MRTKLRLYVGLTFLLALLNITLSSPNLFSQNSFILSKNSDYSTDDRIFDHEDTLFMRVVAPDIEFTDIDENEFELKAVTGGREFEGAFDNLLDGTYTASLALRILNSSEEQWLWKAEIRDGSGHEFRAEVELSILGGVQKEEVKINGEIQGLGDNFLVVKGVTILVDDATIIKDKKDDVPLSFGDLELGQNVEVKAVRQENGELLAVLIEVRSRKKGEIVVKGVIEEIGFDPHSLVVLGTTFFVDANTTILDKDKKDISLSDLTVGLRVKIHARRQADGTLLARLIKVEKEKEREVELTGFIEEIVVAENKLTVSGVTFFVDNSTRIFDANKNPISLDQLSVGQLVEVRAVQQLDGTLLATKIEVEDEVPAEDEIEVTGEIKEIDITNNLLVVSSFTFSVDEMTVILDDRKREISLGDLQVGVVVEVEAKVQPDGSFLATRIKIKDRLKDKIEITGVIESLSLQDSTVVVNGLTFEVDESTLILGQKKNPIPLSDLQPGLVVEIHAEILADGTFLATKIEVKKRDENEVEVTGTIETLGMDNLMVSGVTFFVDAATLVLDSNKNPINFADLVLDQIVEVKGIRRPDGTFLATKIEVKDRIEDEVEVKGTIEGLTGDTITVLGLTFNVTENTVVLDINKNPISFSALSQDQFVKVRGELLPGGTLVALRIKIEDMMQPELEVKGPIGSLRASSVFVLGIEILVDDNTEILDKKNNRVAFSDLKVGQTVEIRASLQPDGGFLALRIKIKDVVVISGSMSNIGTSSFSIFNSEFLVDENTLVLGLYNLHLSFADLTDGQIVDARATRLADGSMLASKIKILTTGSITGVEESEGELAVPKEYVLEQNYPNPFNPTTTITFKLPNTDLAQTQVSLVIYNLLGQSVKTLVNQTLKPGVYKVQWDGRDDFDKPSATGIYFYRLKAGEFLETRMMTLMK
ncbi:MAG: DUF5666 domain-containing protein [bacterium]